MPDLYVDELTFYCVEVAPFINAAFSSQRSGALIKGDGEGNKPRREEGGWGDDMPDDGRRCRSGRGVLGKFKPSISTTAKR